MRYFAGIDPGKSGCIVIIDDKGKLISKHKMPVQGKAFDKRAIKDILCNEHLEHIVMEEVGIIFGISKTSMCDIYRGMGIIEGIIEGVGQVHTLIPPKKWQAEMWQGVTKVTYPTKRKRKDGTFVHKTDTKKTSLLAARNLFPKDKLTLPAETKYYTDSKVNINKGIAGRPIPSKANKPNDGYVDARLIAEYCRRKYQ